MEEEFKVFELELSQQSYRLRSDEDEQTVAAIFERIIKELEELKSQQNITSQRECLLVLALHLTKKIIRLEEENKVFKDLLNL